MTTIHKNNCEAYFLDYYEGKLDQREQELLFAFLRENPEWEKVFDEYREIPDAEVVLNSQREDSMPLADQPVQQDEEADLIALLEGQLNETDAQNLRHKIAHNATLAAAFRGYELTRLTPDMGIVYPDKASLKKGAPIFTLFAQYSGIAALMAGAFIAVWVFSMRETTPPMAEYHPRAIETDNTMNARLKAVETQAQTTQNVQLGESAAIATEKLAVQTTAGNHRENPGSAKEIQTAIPSTENTATEHSLAKRVEVKSMNVKTEPAELLASVNIDAPQLVKPDLPGKLPEPRPVQPANNVKAPERSLFGTFLSDLGQTVVSRVKAATDEEVVIESEVDPEDDLVTSTFKLGAFELYRSKSKK